MRVHLCVVGRLRAGPENDLITDYLKRFDRTGRALSLGPVNVIEVEDKKGGGMRSEAALLRKAIPDGALTCALDERGRVMASTTFANILADKRDQGRGDMAFIIGGADGIDPKLLADVDMKLSFGQMVWPHMLARVMLCEQLYRAASILSGGPYHRA